LLPLAFARDVPQPLWRKNSFFKAAGGLGPSSVWKEASLDEKEGGCYQGEKEEGEFRYLS